MLHLKSLGYQNSLTPKGDNRLACDHGARLETAKNEREVVQGCDCLYRFSCRLCTRRRQSLEYALFASAEIKKHSVRLSGLTIEIAAHF